MSCLFLCKDLDELDDESESIKDSSIIANGKSELLPDIKTTQIAETRLEASKTSSSNGVLVSTAMLDAKAMKVPNASGNDDLNGLDFPVLPLPGSSSIPSTIPGSAMPLFQPTPLKEKVSSPILKDGLMAYSAGSPSMAAGSDGRNFLARLDRIDNLLHISTCSFMVVVIVGKLIKCSINEYYQSK